MSDIKPLELYFASANTADGFRNHFGSIFSPRDCYRRILLKGGPGTGKSYLLRRAATLAEDAGFAVERFLCSSDPDSLDGVLFTDRKGRKTAIFDATAPHMAEADMPGVRDELWDLGAFWDSDVLRRYRDAAEILSEKKNLFYRTAMEGLQAAGILEKQIDRFWETVFRDHPEQERKLERSVHRFLSFLPKATRGGEKIRQISAIGMKGAIVLSTYADLADRILPIQPFYGMERFYLEKMRELAEMKEIPHRVSLDLFSGLPEALYFPGEKLAVLPLSVLPEPTENHGESEEIKRLRGVNLRRFLPENLFPVERRYLRELEKQIAFLVSFAKGRFAGMREAHFTLETLYGAAMDFDRKDRYTEAALRDLIESAL